MTRPCEGMQAAMASARVGDDVYGEDPTTKQLEVAIIKKDSHQEDKENEEEARLYALNYLAQNIQ